MYPAVLVLSTSSFIHFDNQTTTCISTACKSLCRVQSAATAHFPRLKYCTSSGELTGITCTATQVLPSCFTFTIHNMIYMTINIRAVMACLLVISLRLMKAVITSEVVWHSLRATKHPLHLQLGRPHSNS